MFENMLKFIETKTVNAKVRIAVIRCAPNKFSSSGCLINRILFGREVVFARTHKMEKMDSTHSIQSMGDLSRTY